MLVAVWGVCVGIEGDGDGGHDGANIYMFLTRISAKSFDVDIGQ